MKRGIIALLAATFCFAAKEPVSRWWSHVEYLAGDALEGRKPGTAGYDKAAQYVASQFDALKLQPGGSNGWFQPVRYHRMQLNESGSRVELISKSGTQRLQFGRDVNISLRGKSGQNVDADMVFVGNGLVVPEAGIDDLKGLDLKGKVAIVLPGAPSGLDGPLASHAQSTAEIWRHLRDAGAIGIARLYNPNVSDIPWARLGINRAEPVLELTIPELVDTAGQQIYFTIGPDIANRFLADTGHTLSNLIARMKSGQPLPKFPLKTRIRANIVFDTTEISSANVIGVLPGSDPRLRTEYVVFTAHLDHLGAGQPIKGDKIYNGAMDNASGVATLIETARAMQGRKLKRSVAFIAVTGEEAGLTGSKFFANRSTLKGRIVAGVNTDMYLPIIPLKGIVALGKDESDLGDDFAAAAAQFDIPVERDPEPHRNSFTRSDQYSFIRLGIPALAFKFYASPGTNEAAMLRQWRTDRYHAPSDDLEQPVNIEGAEQFNRVMAVFLERVANRDTRPQWKPSSFFRRFAQPVTRTARPGAEVEIQ